ncbi:hypothetical protein B0I27_109102 [Arcticibacter pallidicorallinus]|uniref:Uncharacterized protein n=1 Tax=Arcticibacter pallidicorallinus TaxID=1259464 RepID=A0A2T0TXJ9_9SPHI|nr:hypothetical protein B0I27_109102 [Arcticibacter pallidicorallinus]
MAKKPKYRVGNEVLYRGNKYSVGAHIPSPVGHYYSLEGRLGLVDEIELTTVKMVLTGNQKKAS